MEPTDPHPPFVPLAGPGPAGVAPPATPPAAPPGPAVDGSSGDGGRSGHRLDRRRFLALAGGLGAAGALGAALGPRAYESLTGATAAAGPHVAGGRTLVLLTLYGGNDGLNTVIPYRDPHYAAGRGALAVPESAVLPLDDGFGLHPSLRGLHGLWQARQLAVVHGVGFSNPNYSHFESMDIWQSGVPGTPVSTGWLGRWLDRTGGDPLRALAIGPTLPTLLTGEHAHGSAIPTGPFVLPGGRGIQARYSALAQAGSSGGAEPTLLADSAGTDADLLTVQHTIGPVLNRTAQHDPLALHGATASAGAEGALAIADGGGGSSAPNVLATQLSMVANLILAGSRSEVYSVELGGFDTHAQQAATQTRLLGQLDAAVTAFLHAIADHPRGRETVVVVYTEFGRRVSANASAGTDHGWANVVLAAGQPVRGGFYGQPPSLSRLSEGNLVFTTDFRSVYATVLDQILGVDPTVFLGRPVKSLPFV